MSESVDNSWLRAGLNRLVGMKVIESWEMQTSGEGSKWEIRINEKTTLKKSSANAKSFVHGAMAASSATIDQKACARVLSDSTLRVEAKRRGMTLVE